MDFSGQGLQSQHADFISRDQLFPVDEMELFSRSRASETKVSRLWQDIAQVKSRKFHQVFLILI